MDRTIEKGTLPPALFMTDRHRCPDPDRVIRRLPSGFGVILRDYDHPDRPEMARRLAELCRRRGLLLIVGGDPALARAVDAFGLHLPERLVADFDVRDRPAGRILTAAAHSEEAIRRAAGIGADAVLLSPVFRTASHPDKPWLGPGKFARMTAASPVPVYALGGLNRERLAELPDSSKLAGYAGIGIFMGEEKS